MKIRPDQISQHLQGPLLPLYFVCGDEPLQVMETADAIRACARGQGYSEREVMDVETGFDWAMLLDAGNSLSLFAEQRILELRMPNGKPGKQGGQALVDYAARPAEDAVLIITSGKLEGAAKNSKWFKALDGAGAVIQCWPVKPGELPRWIQQRLRSRGISADDEGVRLLAERVEGNLLAAAQEVEKLLLLYGEGSLTAEQIAGAVSDSARYNIYDLVDTAVAGDLARSLRMLNGLRHEGTEPTLVLWALSREIRQLTELAASGQPVEAAMATARIWDSRKPLVRQALQRRSPRGWLALLKRCGKVDRTIKGVETGRPWDELFTLTRQLATIKG